MPSLLRDSILSLPIEIVADSRSLESSIGITVSRQKPLDKLVFRDKVVDETQVAYVGYPLVTYNRSIGLVDESVGIWDNLNSLTGFDYWEICNTNPYVSDTPNIWVTNRAVIQGSTVVPLFYGMSLPPGTIRATAASYLQDPMDFHWQYDSEARAIFCSHNNYWDPNLKDFRGINIRYTTLVDGVEETKTTLFSAAAPYREADIYDVDPDTLSLYEDRPVYGVVSTPTGYEFTFNGSGPYYIVKPEPVKIGAHRTGGSLNNEPWLLEIDRSKLFRTVSGVDFRYETLEYADQSFFPRYPYVTYNHKADILDSKTLRLLETGLVIDPSRNLHFDIVIYDSTGTIKFLYTTSPLKIGKPYDRWSWASRDVLWQELEVGFDQTNSIVSLYNAEPILATDHVACQYVVEQRHYIYRDLNLNPNYNGRIYTHDYVLYMVPSSRAEGNRTLFHIELDYNENGEAIITGCTQPSITESLLGTKYVDFRNTYCANGIDTDPQPPPPPGPPVISLPLSTGTYFQYLVLCRASLRQSFRQDEILVQDIRLKMGVDAKKQLEVLKKHPWLYWNKAFEDRAIEMPDKFLLSLSVDKTQVFEQDETKYAGLAYRHAAAGSGLVFSPGGIQPRVYDIYCVTSEELTVSFMPEALGTDHHLYRLQSANGIPNLTSDDLIASFTIAYGTSLHTELVDVSAIVDDTHKFYMVTENNSIFSQPSQIFTVRIRYV